MTPPEKNSLHPPRGAIPFLFARIGDLAIALIRLVRGLRSGNILDAIAALLRSNRAALQARHRLTLIRLHRFHARATPRQITRTYLGILLAISFLLCLLLLLI